MKAKRVLLGSELRVFDQKLGDLDQELSLFDQN